MRAVQISMFTLFSALHFTASASSVMPEKLMLSEHITLSGLSSGGYMAGQYHLAFAEQVQGVAMLASGPVYCAQNSLGIALEHCFNKATSAPDSTAIASYITSQRQLQKLSPETAMVNDKVWIFSGTKDTTVNPKLAIELYNQYTQWVKPEQIALVNAKPFGHTFPTDSSQWGACDTSESPYLANCNYDAAGELLEHLLGTVKPKSDTTTGKLINISQHKLSDAAKTSLAETGYLYVPASCLAGELCQLHVSLHGCKQNAENVDQAYVTGTGLNNYADTNRLVVLYPQTTASSINPFNPNACWDWWGYTGAQYSTKDGVQLQAIHQLVQALMQ